MPSVTGSEIHNKAFSSRCPCAQVISAQGLSRVDLIGATTYAVVVPWLSVLIRIIATRSSILVVGIGTAPKLAGLTRQHFHIEGQDEERQKTV